MAASPCGNRVHRRVCGDRLLLLELNPGCTRCPLHANARTVCMGGERRATTGPRLTPDTPLLVVGRGPSAQEDRDGRPFVGPGGTIIRRLLAPLEIEYRLTNAVKCWSYDQPKPSMLAACRDYLINEIFVAQPRVILALGNDALVTLTATSGVGHNRGKPLDLRGQIANELRKAGWRENHPKVLVTWDPGFVIREPAREKELQQDLGSMARYLRTLQGIEQGETVEWSEKTFDVDNYAPVWSFDIETNGREFRDPEFKILMCGISDGRRTVVLRGAGKLSIVSKLLELRVQRGLINVGQNSIAFDDVGLGNPFTSDDVMLLAYLADESAESHSLQASAIRYLQVPPWKDAVSWDWAKYDEKKHFAAAAEYNARDTFYTHRLYTKLVSLLEPDQMRLYHKLLKPTAKVLSVIEQNGCPVSRAKAEHALRVCDEQIAATREFIVTLAEKRDIENFNPRSVPQMQKLLYGRDLFGGLELTPVKYTEKQAPSTDAESLQALRLRHPEHATLFDSLMTFREYDKLRGTYVTPLLKQIEGQGEHAWVYPRYSIVDTTTGRSSSYGWSPQRTPRDPLIRSIVTAPPGQKMLYIDLSQIELRTMAFLSRDPNMLRIYQEDLYGGDMHSYMALQIATKQNREPTKDDRQIAKPTDFGCLYGAEVPTLQAYFLNQYGLRMSEQDVAFLRNEVFFGTFTTLPDYYRKVIAEMREKKYVTSPLGRRRRLENIDAADQSVRAEAARQGINTINQGFAWDISAIGTFLLHKNLGGTVKLVASVHDAILGLVDEREDTEMVAQVAKEIFEKGTIEYMEDEFELRFDVPLKADVKLVSSWN